MKSQYDVVVIGGGPAGAMSALVSSQLGVTTILLERDRKIGLPVRCGEVAALKPIEEYLPVPKHIIVNPIENSEYITSDHQKFIYKTTEKEAVIDRRLFDSHIAELATHAGAEIFTQADVIGMHPSEYGKRIEITHQGEERRLETKLVIAADGIESRVARWAGLQTAIQLKDLESSFQYSVTNLNIDNPHVCRIYFDDTIAPGGYIWVFPKSREKANIGGAVLASRARGTTAKEYVEQFMKRRFADAIKVSFTTGGIPLAKPMDTPISDGLLVVGDAARFVNSLTGEGIRYAIASGALAGNVAVDAVKKGKWNTRVIREYSRLCNREFSSQLKKIYRISQILRQMNDEEFCEVGRLARKVGPTNLNPVELSRILIREHPKLALKSLKALF